MKQPLLIEIKEIRNVCTAFQVEDNSAIEGEKKGTRTKDATYQLKAHDGVRPIKIILLFEPKQQIGIVNSINEVNKYCLYNAQLR